MNVTAKEYKRAIADARRDASREYGFHQSAFINYKEKAGYFFCIYFFSEEAVLTVKPIYVDDLWWEIWNTPKNMSHPKSLRGRGVYSVPGQILTSYTLPDSNNCGSVIDISATIASLFGKITDVIENFLLDNPSPINFYPDESKMPYDPDRLLYLMSLIKNMRYEEALDIIKTARKNGYRCNFRSGPFIDSYTYIKCYCKNRIFIPKILNVLFRNDNFYKNASQSYNSANAFLRQKPMPVTPWYVKIPGWSYYVVLLIVIIITFFLGGGVRYRTLFGTPYLTPHWVGIIVGLAFALIPILIFAIKNRRSSKDKGIVGSYLIFSVLSGVFMYIFTPIGIIWFCGINYRLRDHQQFTTRAVVTDDRWEYKTHTRGLGTTIHYVNVLDLPEEHRKITAVDGYIHYMPTDTEFDLVYSKGFLGFDIFEDAINIRYPSEDY